MSGMDRAIEKRRGPGLRTFALVGFGIAGLVLAYLLVEMELLTPYYYSHERSR